MVGWLVPASYRLVNCVRDRLRGNIGGRPHMIEAPSTVGSRPILCAVTPPGMKSPRRGKKLPSKIDPTRRRLHPSQRFDFDWRMADCAEQLFVTPDIAFERGDVEITDEQGGAVERFRPARHAFEEIQFLAELVIDVAVRNIAPGGDIDVFEPHPVRQPHTDVASFSICLPVQPVILDQRNTREDCDAVVHLLAVQHLMDVAQVPKCLCRKDIVQSLGFLKTEDVGRFLAEELLDDTDAEPDRIDVPGSDFQRVVHQVRCSDANRSTPDPERE
jgi:hypothetical protein